MNERRKTEIQQLGSKPWKQLQEQKKKKAFVEVKK